MLIDARQSADLPSESSTDLLIVGAGTIGLYLAASLALRKHYRKITLLEAGSKVATTQFNELTATSIGCPHFGLKHGRAIGLGGTSTLWGGQLAEFDALDLERPGAPWPLRFEELCRNYQVVYRNLNIGPLASTSAYRRRLGGEIAAHDAIQRFFTYWLPQPNFAAVFKSLIDKESTLQVLVNVVANGIVFDGQRASRLLCTTSDGRRVQIAAEHFVFASGTIATSRFFLSTRSAPSIPWSANDHIGRYFQDHLGGKIAEVSVLSEQRFRDYFENAWVGGVKLQPKLTFSKEYGARHKSGVCGMFAFHSSVSENLSNLKALLRSIRSGISHASLGSSVKDAFVVGKSLLPIALRFARDRRMMALFDQGISLHIQAEQIPLASSRIVAADSVPAADGLLPVTVDWQWDGAELDAIRNFSRCADAYLQANQLARLAIDPQLLDGSPRFLEGLRDTFHQCGGMRMSSSPSDGVVDPSGRVWGTENVWVSGASVFPSSSHANCTLTALALTERLAARLEREFGGHA